MAYNDYPGVSDSYDDERTPEQSALDAALDKRTRVQSELDTLQHEGDGYTVLGRFFPNIDDARFVRGLALDSRFRSLERLDATIARLMTEIEPDDAAGFDPDAVADAEWTERHPETT